MEAHSTPETVRPDDRTNRLQRFADWGQNVDERGREEGPGAQPFYYGKGVAERTNVVRGAIEYVRENWQNFEMLMEGLRVLLKKRLGDPLPPGDTEDFHRLLSSSKVWIDRRGEGSTDDESDYSAIRLYASSFGHREIFKIVNSVLRADTKVSQQEGELNTVVFLVELVNVDLFNYVSLVPHANNYQGVVFRALAASTEQLQSFKELAARPISERYWAVPLSLISASRNQEMVVSYAKEEVRVQPNSHLFLWRIHAVELEAELLQLYREQYPSSVVSTICAVPIQGLSQFPDEDEVVLRGPFFQLIRMQEEIIDGVGRVHVIDSVMLTVNRDHPSTMELGQTEGNRARDLMGCLVGIGRARACKKLAEDWGMFDDARVYEQLIEEGNERLKGIL
ncbi:hypothetical protein DXG01_013864 [Tephrocybe rancida]|nr:hypothetical protein DXG01_013864 [Tephrocybe rancida]